MSDDIDQFQAAAKAAFSDDSDKQAYTTLASIGSTLIAEFSRAQTDRREVEQRWLKDLRQYKGIYDPEVLQRIGDKRSRSFVRKTRVKVRTLDARMMDLLFPSGSVINWTIGPTPNPSISKAQRQKIIDDLAQAGAPPSKETLNKAIREFAKKASVAMGETIEDQLADTRYRDIAAKVVHSGNLYGHGILKAPLVEKKVRQRYVSEGGKWQIQSETYVAPFLEYVPIWRWYPDMSATDLKNCRYVYELHAMTKTKLAGLCDRKAFNAEAIKNYILSHPEGETLVNTYDTELRSIGERIELSTSKQGLYDVLERWGWIDATTLEQCGVKIPDDRRHESFFANIWLFPNGEVIRASMQPINGVTWPYHIYYFDKDETSIFAEGVSAILRDDQEMINASGRMILDNAAHCAGPQYEVNTRLLNTTDTVLESFPFKVWTRSGEDPNSRAVNIIDVPSHINELAAIKQMFEASADEVLALPRFMNGENATSGAAGTASGMSMLMGAANISVKDLIGNYDEGVTNSFITAIYRWNMQFNQDESIKGDFDVQAGGSSSLVAKEIRNNQLTQFTTTLQPEERMRVKWDAVTKAKAEALDMGHIVLTEDEAKEQANSPEAQQQAQIQQQQMQLALAKMEAENAKLMAETERLKAVAMEAKVSAAYAAMQAAGVTLQNTTIAPAGDAILRAAGWQDAQMPAVQGGQPIPVDPSVPLPQAPAPMQGHQAGMQTPELEGVPV